MKAKYKNQKIGVFGDENTEKATEDELATVDEELLDLADAKVNAEMVRKAAQQAEALGIQADAAVDAGDLG